MLSDRGIPLMISHFEPAVQFFSRLMDSLLKIHPLWSEMRGLSAVYLGLGLGLGVGL